MLESTAPMSRRPKWKKNTSRDNFLVDRPTPKEGTIGVPDGSLYYREIGHGQPIIVLHGATSAFDHKYLLPDLDGISSESCRLIYYDQRGRGMSVSSILPQAITIQSETDDLDAVRNYIRLDSVALLGHSWGALLALEYALRHPSETSHLILMNTAPVSYDDWALFQREMSKREHAEELERLEQSPEYVNGDPETVAYDEKLFLSYTLKQPERLERLIRSMTDGASTKTILRVRKIAESLWKETLDSPGYDLVPNLGRVKKPTLVIHGEQDFVPRVCATRIAQAIPEARFALIRDSGHFSYLERPEVVRKEIEEFLGVRRDAST